MNKLLFVCSRTTNDEHRGVIAVQDVFKVNDANYYLLNNPSINSIDIKASIFKSLYIHSAIKNLNIFDAVSKEEECTMYIYNIAGSNSNNIIHLCKTELEQYYDSIVCFSNKLEAIDFNFHKDK